MRAECQASRRCGENVRRMVQVVVDDIASEHECDPVCHLQRRIRTVLELSDSVLCELRASGQIKTGALIKAEDTHRHIGQHVSSRLSFNA